MYWFTSFKLFSSSLWLLQRILYPLIKSLFKSYSSMYPFLIAFLKRFYYCGQTHEHLKRQDQISAALDEVDASHAEHFSFDCNRSPFPMLFSLNRSTGKSIGCFRLHWSDVTRTLVIFKQYVSSTVVGCDSCTQFWTNMVFPITSLANKEGAVSSEGMSGIRFKGCQDSTDGRTNLQGYS